MDTNTADNPSGAIDPNAGATAFGADAAATKPPVPAHIIPAELPHPNTVGGVLARGVKYLHHFELLLVSDGKRLWAAASEEGRAVLAAIEGEKQAEQDVIDAHKTAPAAEAGMAAQAGTAATDKDPANPNVT